MTFSAFSFGYEGWGSCTRALVETVDAVEAARGFAPPVFVDARLRRSVRAVGFRDRAFEQLLGVDRYRWLKGLGNSAIADGGEWRLHDDSALDTLLALIETEQRERRRRIIFFCSCGQPGTGCHRHQLIAKQLIRRARSAETSLDVVEWPGGPTTTMTQHVDRQLVAALRSKAAIASPSQPRSMRWPHPELLHSAAWGSVLRATADDDTTVDTWIGPPTASRDAWYLPIIGTPSGSFANKKDAGGYLPLSSIEHPASLPVSSFLQQAIYTIAHPDTVAAALPDRALTLTVHRPMTSAMQLLQRARDEACNLLIVVNDATDCRRVLATGRVVSLSIDDKTTTVVIDDVQRTAAPRLQSELTVTSTQAPLVNFIRPYALIDRPRWR
ncbi:MAG TPA: hypothetical protein VGF99_05245 [Myxococcota bacterium]